MRNIAKFLAVPALILAVGASGTVLAAESAGQYIDDATITTKVKAALIGDQELKAMKISVATDQGSVQLSGTVDNKTQEAEAVKDANQVNGVKQVKDLLTVKATD